MDQTTGRDDFLNTTVIESATDDISPVSQVCNKHFVVADLRQNILFDLGRRIGLFESHRETFKESFVENVSPDETTIITTLTLSVCSRNHVETLFGLNVTTDLLEEDTLTLKNRLETQDLIGRKINFI